MNKRKPLNIGGFICLLAVSYFIYYLLLPDNILPFTIPSALTCINHWVRHWHVLAVGLLPIYLALMIFGAGVLGIYFGSAAQRWLTRFLHHK